MGSGLFIYVTKVYHLRAGDFTSCAIHPHHIPSELLVHDPPITIHALQLHVVVTMCSPRVSGTLVAMNLHSWRCVVGVLMTHVKGVPLVEGEWHIMYEARTT